MPQRRRIHSVPNDRREETKSTNLSCIMEEDPDHNIGFQSNYEGESANAIAEWKHKWETNIVTYGVTNESKHFPNSSIENRAMTVALRVWGLRIKDIKFRRIRDTTAQTPDIPLTFIEAENDKLFTDRPSVLAYAYFPTNSPIGGDITFNESRHWSLDGAPIPAWRVDPIHYDKDSPVKMASYNMVHTMIHEIGHALGLKHDEYTRDAIMYPYYNGSVNLHTRDIERIQLFYGKRNISSRWTDYFARRLRMGIVR